MNPSRLRQSNVYQTSFARTFLRNPGIIAFGEFISPKENVTLSLKDSRFNRLPECCLRLLYLVDDIEAYLQKNPDILNNVAIIDRAFVKMEILKPIFTSIAILGLPHHKAVPQSAHEQGHKLLDSYQKLYESL